jgi:hypothetical protein
MFSALDSEDMGWHITIHKVLSWAVPVEQNVTGSFSPTKLFAPFNVGNDFSSSSPLKVVY